MNCEMKVKIEDNNGAEVAIKESINTQWLAILLSHWVI